MALKAELNESERSARPRSHGLQQDADALVAIRVGLHAGLVSARSGGLVLLAKVVT